MNITTDELSQELAAIESSFESGCKKLQIIILEGIRYWTDPNNNLDVFDDGIADKLASGRRTLIAAALDLLIAIANSNDISARMELIQKRGKLLGDLITSHSELTNEGHERLRMIADAFVEIPEGDKESQ